MDSERIIADFELPPLLEEEEWTNWVN